METTNGYPVPTKLEDFDMSEVYRIIHNEQIPGFRLLDSEIAYIQAYRDLIREQYEQEEAAKKKSTRKYTRRKKVEVEDES